MFALALVVCSAVPVTPEPDPKVADWGTLTADDAETLARRFGVMGLRLGRYTIPDVDEGNVCEFFFDRSHEGKLNLRIKVQVIGIEEGEQFTWRYFNWQHNMRMQLKGFE